MGTVPARFVRRINASLTGICVSTILFEPVWTVPIFPDFAFRNGRGFIQKDTKKGWLC